MNFSLTPEQAAKAKQFLKEQNETHFKGEPAYFGAIGGGLTYHFSPSSIGTFAWVTHDITKEKLDLNDYDAF